MVREPFDPEVIGFLLTSLGQLGRGAEMRDERMPRTIVMIDMELSEHELEHKAKVRPGTSWRWSSVNEEQKAAK